MRTIEAIKTNKRSTTRKHYDKSRLEKFDFPDLHVWILRCFEAHKLDNNIGLKPSQWAIAYIIFQDYRFLNMKLDKILSWCWGVSDEIICSLGFLSLQAAPKYIYYKVIIL